MPGDGRRRRHFRTHQVSAAARSLPPFKVSVGCGRAAFAWHEDVRVHAEAHRTAGVAPLEARVEENLVETFLLRLGFDETGAWHDHRAQRVRHLLAADHGRRGA